MAHLTSPLNNFLSRKLKHVKDGGLSRYRKILLDHSPAKDNAMLTGIRSDFCSNDYLGLSHLTKPKTIEVQSFGSGGSHLLSGHKLEHRDLEKQLSHFLKRDAAIIYSSGYMANLGILQALAQKGDLIISDKLNHASLIDGARLSRADVVRYAHCDIKKLEQRLKVVLRNSSANKWVVTDSIFSMDGDIAPLNEISYLCKKYDAHLIVDDAHGFGVLGKKGQGACDYFGLTQEDCPVLMSTLGKALGGYGACVSGKQIMIDYLVQFSRPFIYTTAPPVINSMLNSYNLNRLAENPELVEQLNSNIDYFRCYSIKLRLPFNDSKTPIQVIDFKSIQFLMKAKERLEQNGFFVSAIRPPTSKTPRLRITISASHSRSEIEQLLKTLSRIMNYETEHE